nr:hypothetical protein [Lachnospiraceae bacterium]
MKRKSFIIIFIIAAVILCAACSSSTKPISDSGNVSNGSVNDNTVTGISEPELTKHENNNELSVEITTGTAGATIFYSTDGVNFQKYNGLLKVTDIATIYAYAELDGVKSKTVGATFTAPKKNGTATEGNNNDTGNKNTANGNNSKDNNTGNSSDKSSSDGNNGSNGSLSSADLAKARANYKPEFTVNLTGNFTDIDQSLFENSYYHPDQIVGRWYEDGWTNGYYLEVYGDGTWQYFGEETINGTYWLMNNSFDL